MSRGSEPGWQGSHAALARRSAPQLMLLAIVATLAFTAEPSAGFEPPAEPTIAQVPADWPDPPTVDAEAYVLVDADTGQVLAQHRAHERRPVASTIKVLTALTAMTRSSPEDEVTVGGEVLVGGASVGLAPGDVWTVEDLVNALIARSGNDAAQALAVHVAGDAEAFVEMMAQDLLEMGISGAVLDDSSGLTDGNLLSAADLATIARVALADDQLRPILAEPAVTLPGLGVVESRNLLLQSYPEATGVKTGFTTAAGHSLVASARRGERELVAVALGSGEDPARFDAAAALLDHGFEAFRATELAAELRFVVSGGAVVLEVPQVALSVPSDLDALLRLPLQARPPDELDTVPIEVAGETVGQASATLERTGSALEEGGTVAVGRGLVDGVYAALRAGAATDSLR